MSTYSPSESRYETMSYKRCGRSGIKLPEISLGLCHNFGGVDRHENSRAMLLRAFDLGITHFDLANNYGPPPGSAESTFGQILDSDLRPHRDELLISTKAGYLMWSGPYGQWGSRKYLLSSLDQSLKRMRLEYVDIFYLHRPDPETPLEESMSAIDHAVRAGKALYAGVSSLSAEQTLEASKILRRLGPPCLIPQPVYNMLNRSVEGGLLDVLRSEGIGCISFSPLAQGLLTDKYLDGIPENSRAAQKDSSLRRESISAQRVDTLRTLNGIAKKRGQSLAQMSLAWVLRHDIMTSVVIGASRVEQIEENVAALKRLDFTPEELAAIEGVLKG